MNISEKPRVRFAPSPTGDLHVGNARIALLNWLFARHHHGTLVLRLEDTDETRSTRQFEENLLHDLNWLSLDWDEGPGKDGKHGPYRQSERLDIYRRYLDQLIRDGRVYPCYCTEEELEAERMSLLSRRMTPRYMGKCRNLTDEKKRALEAEGRKPTYRFKVGPDFLEFTDLIRGAMKFDAEAIGDFIIVRSSGIPAYNFAVVIDDHLMEITHVIRGEDHLSNTALQLLLYKALDFSPPVFAHHSLILGKDRTKLSKRHGSVSVREFREKGILPMALLNYLSLLGSSLGEGREVCPLDEIIRSFTLTRAGKSGAIFDEDKLDWLNRLYIKQSDTPELVKKLVPFMARAGYNTPAFAFEQERLIQIVDIVKDNLASLADIGYYLPIFFDNRFQIDNDARHILMESNAAFAVNALKETLVSAQGSKPDYVSLIKVLEKKTGLKGKRLFMPLRAALTGRSRGPELARVYAVLDETLILSRLDRVLAELIS